MFLNNEGMEVIKKHARNQIRLFGIGFAMGSADVVPGVSGGTIAFIFGVFEELVYSIKKLSGEVLRLILKLQIKKALNEAPFYFLVPLFIGLMTALVTLSGVISGLLKSHPVFIWSFFFGLVLSSVFIVRKRVITWDLHDYLVLIVSAMFAYFLTGIVPVETPETVLAFFLSGMIAICAMILPGISGSFLLILMGKYEQVLNAVVSREIFILAVFMAGAVVGLALFSRVINWLFTRHHDIIISILTGFMIGSLRKVWPWKEVVETRLNRHGVEVPLQEINILPNQIDSSLMVSLLLVLFAVLIMFYLDKSHLTDEEVDVLEDPEYEKMHKKALKLQKHL